MKGSRSISLWLTIFVSLAVISGGILAWPFVVWMNSLIKPKEFRGLNALGLNQAQYVVRQSLRRGSDGAAYVENTPVLRAYKIKNPKFRFAVFEGDSGSSLSGSDAELVAAIRSDSGQLVYRTSLRLGGDSDPDLEYWMYSTNTAIGRLPIALYGYSFHWDDLLYIAHADMSEGGLYFVPEVLLAVGASWFIVRRGLLPLNVAARRIAQIDMNALDGRISHNDLPTEVMPFVSAVNDTLARLERGVARQQRFIADAAHELRTPITILCTHIDNPDEATFRKDVKRDALRLRMIVEQLLSAAAISNHQGAPNEKVDLGKITLETIVYYMPLAIENRRKIELDCPSEPIVARGSRRGIESVLANLIDNALRAEPEGGTVVVRIHPDRAIEIADHGEGVAPKDRVKIFEPFWRKSGTKASGTGLGLSIVKEIMDELGGRVWVEDTPGGGATFKLMFGAADTA
jgi:signal transduction histidine kinase